MQRQTLIQTGILAAGLAATWTAAGTVTARADVITLDVSGSMLPSSVFEEFCYQEVFEPGSPVDST